MLNNKITKKIHRPFETLGYFNKLLKKIQSKEIDGCARTFSQRRPTNFPEARNFQYSSRLRGRAPPRSELNTQKAQSAWNMKKKRACHAAARALTRYCSPAGVRLTGCVASSSSSSTLPRRGGTGGEAPGAGSRARAYRLTVKLISLCIEGWAPSSSAAVSVHTLSRLLREIVTVRARALASFGYLASRAPRYDLIPLY